MKDGSREGRRGGDQEKAWTFAGKAGYQDPADDYVDVAIIKPMDWNILRNISDLIIDY